jgi:hypothetical protein
MAPYFPNNVPSGMAHVYVQNTDTPHGAVHAVAAQDPAMLGGLFMPEIKPVCAENPARTIEALDNALPGVIYCRYVCKRKCRNKGICVHYSVVCGARNCPDGLICNRCSEPKGAVTEIKASRMCPYCNHYGLEPAHPNYSVGVNLPEDYLPAHEQWGRLSELLERNWTNNFDGAVDIVKALPPRDSKRNWCNRIGEEVKDSQHVNPKEADPFVVPIFDHPGLPNAGQTDAGQDDDSTSANAGDPSNSAPAFSAANESYTSQNASQAVFVGEAGHTSTAKDANPLTAVDKGKAPIRNTPSVATPPITSRATVGGHVRRAASIGRGHGPVRTQTGINYGPYARTPRAASVPFNNG